MRPLISQFLADENGSAGVEYSLVISAVALGVIAGAVSVGEALSGIYQTIISGLASIGGAAG